MLADANWPAIEAGGVTDARGPQFITEGIVDDADKGLIAVFINGRRILSGLGLQCDGDAGVRNAVSEVDGAVDRINDPTKIRILLARDAFFAEQGDIWKG